VIPNKRRFSHSVLEGCAETQAWGVRFANELGCRYNCPWFVLATRCSDRTVDCFYPTKAKPTASLNCSSRLVGMFAALLLVNTVTVTAAPMRTFEGFH